MKSHELNDLVEASKFRVDDFRRFQALGMIPMDGDFFPGGVHYPPITKYPLTTGEEFLRTYTMPPDGKLDIYVHIPFCPRRCVFCHYPSQYGTTGNEKDVYLDALEKEMDLVMRQLGVDRIKARTILLGGGTPTDLTPRQLEHFLRYFTKRLDMSQIRQFNYDVDPWTLVGPDGLERLRIMRDYGVDRLTIGIQSLDEHILRQMNRSHGVSTALESIANCMEYGYQVNIEFIFGYPGQTVANWAEVLEAAVAAGTPEIQLYRLKVIPYGDQRGNIEKVRDVAPERIPPPEEAILMKAIAIEYLRRHGYTENLRRVFTKTRQDISMYAFYQCCQLRDEIGLGQTAFSSLRDRFGINTQYFDEYYKNISEGRLPLNRGIVRSPEEQIRWATILPIKNLSLIKARFKERTGVSVDDVFQEKFAQLEEFGLIENTPTRIELTELGAFFADEVVHQFHDPSTLEFPAARYADGPLNPHRNPARSDGVFVPS